MLGERLNHMDINASKILMPQCLIYKEHRIIVFGRTNEW